MMLQIADDFIDNVVTAACQLAKHRHANTVEVKDVQLHLGRVLNVDVILSMNCKTNFDLDLSAQGGGHVITCLKIFSN